MSRTPPSRLRSHDRNASRVPPHRDRSCPSGKLRYRDHDAAVAALHSADTARYFAELDGTFTRRREIRSYSCGLCHGFHLTSMHDHIPA